MAAVNIFLGSLAYHTQYYFGVEEKGLVLLPYELTSNLPILVTPHHLTCS